MSAGTIETKNSGGQSRTDIDTERFRARLMDERRLAEETVAGTQRGEGSPVAPGSEGDSETVAMGETGYANRAELSDVPTHPADVATELFLREEDQALIGNARDVIAKIDRALAKLDDGTYGLSEISGKPIPIERLEALPYATVLADEAEE